MKKRTKNDYTTEFKDQAVSLVLKSDKTTTQIAQDLGVTGTPLYSSINSKKASKPQGDEEIGEQLFDELKRLKKELAEVKEQRDLLKKQRRTSRKARREVRLDGSAQ